jgi:DNA repair protein RecO
MRHKYGTQALILSRTPIGEASTGVLLLTEDLGIVRARAQGLRKSGSKMASALQTLTLAEVTLVRGKEGWRLTGAIQESSLKDQTDFVKKKCAGRIFELTRRLVRGEHQDAALYRHIRSFVEALPELSQKEQDAAECLVALRILQILGHDAGNIPGREEDFTSPTLEEAYTRRTELIARINHGIAISGL